MILAALLACSPGPEDSAAVLTGWNYGWRDLAHRISLLRVDLAEDGSAELGLVGGDWSTGETASDEATFRITHTMVTTGSAAFARGTVEIIVGPEGEADGEIVLDAADLPERGDLRALLSGFTIVTDVEQTSPEYPTDYDPAYGYTPTGFGFAVGRPVRSGDSVRIPVTARVGWGPQDREDMNRAVPHAITAVEVSALAVSFDGQATDLALTGSTTYEPENPDASIWSGTEQPPFQADASFEGGPRDSFVGWSAFTLSVNPTGDFAGEGEYLRAFGVEADGEAAPRAWDGTVTTTLSSTNLIEFTILTAAYDATLTRIALPDADVTVTQRTGAHPAGTESLGP
jgi:hypothetical protein